MGGKIKVYILIKKMGIISFPVIVEEYFVHYTVIYIPIIVLVKKKKKTMKEDISKTKP